MPRLLGYVVLLALVLLGGAYWYFDEIRGYPAPWEDARNYTSADFAWKVTNAPTWEETMPYHTLALEVRGETHKIEGEYIGCAANENWSREDNELSKLVCWFGGGGDEFSVFKEGDKYFLKHRFIQESGGSEEVAPEGPWETVFEVR